MNVYDCNSVSEILSLAFSRRRKKNLSYSLRAFARDLKISPSRLSELMKNSEGVNAETAQKICEQLKLKPQERKFFLDTVLSTKARNKEVRRLARNRIEKLRRQKLLLAIEEEKFKVISEWYHSAILELTQVTDFQPASDWISQRLGITEKESREAVSRLKKLGLIEVTAGGVWKVSADAYQTFSKSSLAIRKFHLQVLRKSLHSVENDPPHEREIQTMLFAIPKSELPRFSEKMRDFLRESWESISDLPKDELYALSVQLTPMKSHQGKPE